MQEAKAIHHLRQYQKRYGLSALVLAGAVGAVCTLAGWPAAGRGVALGAVFSAANFVLMGEAAARKFALGGGRRLTSTIILIGRYALLAAPVVIAVKVTAFDLPATIAGIFAVQGCIVLETLFGAFRGGSRTV
jgi:hypothetical protein